MISKYLLRWKFEIELEESIWAHPPFHWRVTLYRRGTHIPLKEVITGPELLGAMQKAFDVADHIESSEETDFDGKSLTESIDGCD